MTGSRERFAQLLSARLDADGRVAVVLGDISLSLFAGAAARHPERVINVGIREQLLVSVAGGMALAGLRPVAHTYAPFLVERAYEQIKLDLGHQGFGAVLVSVGASYDSSESGRTHHAPADVALMAALPGVEIHVPGHPDEVAPLLDAALDGDGVAYLRLSEAANAKPMPIQPGRLQVVHRGPGPTIIAVGPMLDRVRASAGELNATLLYAATVRPFDAATLRAELGRSDVVLVEPYLAGTSAAAVAEALADVPHRLLAIGVPPVELRRYGSPTDHDAAYGLDAAAIRARIARWLVAS